MDTDSVVFRHSPGQWKPNLGNFLGEWTDEVAPGHTIFEFTACGPKNYSYKTKDAQGQISVAKKVKGLRLTALTDHLITPEFMKQQVNLFSSKRTAEPLQKPPSKRPCLVSNQRNTSVAYVTALNEAYNNSGIAGCSNIKSAEVEQGPCNCQACSSKQSLTVQQVQFRKVKKHGFIETANIRKEYQLVLNKRWLPRSGTMTFPFGYC